jgi:hypothetical protein
VCEYIIVLSFLLSTKKKKMEIQMLKLFGVLRWR